MNPGVSRPGVLSWREGLDVRGALCLTVLASWVNRGDKKLISGEWREGGLQPGVKLSKVFRQDPFLERHLLENKGCDDNQEVGSYAVLNIQCIVTVIAVNTNM